MGFYTSSNVTRNGASVRFGMHNSAPEGLGIKFSGTIRTAGGNTRDLDRCVYYYCKHGAYS